MIEILEKKDCCGCNACGDGCPVHAISFTTDNEGFLYPTIDKEKCIDCGRCLKICPQINIKGIKKKSAFDIPKCFVAVHKNLAIRFDSTSGGAFSAFANHIYRQGGYVGGAIWNDDYSIRQFISDKKGDLARLRSSKYAQSDAQGFYKAVQEAVNSGKPVLVCGTPCQMAALRSFLGKEYENLFIMDFICRGNNSPLVFRKYLDWQEEKAKGKVIYVKPKNKELGWRKLTTKLVFNNGTIVYDTCDTSMFTKGYLQTNAYCRPSCYECSYKGIPRISDITVADCWGLDGKLPAELDNDLGTSLVLINNDKGMLLWSDINSCMNYMEREWKEVIKGNPMLMTSLPHEECDRNAFFKVLEMEGFGGVIKLFIDPQLKTQNQKDGIKCRCLNKVKHIFRKGKAFLRFVNKYKFRPWAIFSLIHANGWHNVLRMKINLITHPGVQVDVEGELVLNSRLELGKGFFAKPIMKTALAVRRGGRLVTNGSPSFFSYGADIEVFTGGCLEIGSDCGFNIGTTIVCGHHIKIGNAVKGGRHVTIRDNNGGHWMNHVWLCEGCTIMPGVKIGAGAVIGAKAVVFNNVPANTMVIGNPAQVVCEQVEWKY